MLALKYANAEVWRADAMQRKNGISDAEIQQRRAKAQQFYLQQDKQPDADTLADHELFILGKMTQDEYEHYLLCKHQTSAA